MKKRILLIVTSLLLVTAVLFATASCVKMPENQGNNATDTESDVVTDVKDTEADTKKDTEEDTKADTDTEEDTEADTEEDTEEETEAPKDYNVEPENLDGFQLDILAVEKDTWNMHTDLAPTTVTGDTINRAVFQRNSAIQKAYNAKIVAHEDAKYYGMTEKIMNDMIAGTNKYDAAYSEGSSVVSLVTDGSLYNLYELSEIQIEESWWSQLVRREATLGSGKYSTLFFTQSNLSLTAFDLTWCVYFNKTVHETEQIEDLYALVDNNEWTIDKMKVISRNVASLNEDESYSYNANGTAFYGTTTYWNGAKALLDGGNVAFVTTNDDGDVIPNINNNVRFINLTQSLAEMFREVGTFTYGGPSADGTTTGNASDYINIFNAERSLFCVAEVKSSVSDFKTLDNFGILPLPKYDDTQEEYRSWVNYLAPVLVIPKTHDDAGDSLHNTALLLDALSFYSNRDVLPQYYDVVLKGRGTNDPESIRMLDLINDTKSFDASIAYGWSRQFSEALSNTILNGITDVSSLIGTYETMISENIENTLKLIFED